MTDSPAINTAESAAARLAVYLGRTPRKYRLQVYVVLENLIETDLNVSKVSLMV
jgi:hypothetical protein